MHQPDELKRIFSLKTVCSISIGKCRFREKLVLDISNAKIKVQIKKHVFIVLSVIFKFENLFYHNFAYIEFSF